MVSGKFGVGVLKKLCQRVLDGKGMPETWKTSVVVPTTTRFISAKCTVNNNE